MTFTDGFALVIGAGSGIGRDCGIAFAAAGACGVAFADINVVAAEDAAKESNSNSSRSEFRAIAIQVDVSDEESVYHMVAQVRRAFARIDYCINSAGIGVKDPKPVTETSIPEFESFYAIHIKGLMLCVRAVGETMVEQERRQVKGRTGLRDVGRGSIVNLASANAFVATPGMVQYTAAKHAMLGITKTAALDLAPHGVRVNAVCPSWVKTPMVDKAFAGSPELLSNLISGIPVGRIATAEEVSDVVVFLSSPQASYVTGVGWLIDGGTTLQMKLG